MWSPDKGFQLPAFFCTNSQKRAAPKHLLLSNTFLFRAPEKLDPDIRISSLSFS